MSILKIAGVVVTAPDVYNVGIMDINKLERNAKGDMIGERITTKVKIELSWKVINALNISVIQNAISPLFFSVEYFSPKFNALRTGTFYAGDRTCSTILFENGVPTYRDFKFNLIER